MTEVIVGGGTSTVTVEVDTATAGSLAAAERAEIAAAAAEAVGNTNDTIMASRTNDQTSAFYAALINAVLARFVPRDVIVLPLASFLADGQSMPNNGTADPTNAARDLIQGAINACNTAFLADGKVRIIDVPSGVFAISSRLTMPAGGGFGIRGRGKRMTTFLAPRSNSFLGADRPDGPWLFDTYYYRSMVFEDFTIDCSRQATNDNSYNVGLKGFIMHHFRDTRFTRVEIQNSHASAFGCDDWTNVVWEDCEVDGAGLGRVLPGGGAGTFPNPEDRYGSGSAFGLGFGQSPFQTGLIIGCKARNAKAGGFFFEHLGREETPYEATGVRLIGNLAEDCNIGIIDAGIESLIAEGNVIKGSTYAGIYVGRSLTSHQGGSNGRIHNNTIIDCANGIIFAGNAYGGYDVTGNRIIHASNHGIWFPDVSGAFIGPDVKIRDNRILNCGGGGIISENSRLIVGLQITDNIIDGCGADSAKTRREGIAIMGPTARLKINDNKVKGNGGYGIAMWGASIAAYLPEIRRNDLAGSARGGMALEQSIADKTRIADNYDNPSSTVINQVGTPAPVTDFTGWGSTGATRYFVAGGGPVINGVTYNAVKGVATNNAPGLSAPAVSVVANTDQHPAIYAKGIPGKRMAIAVVVGSTYNVGPVVDCDPTGAWQRVDLPYYVPDGVSQIRVGARGVDGTSPWAVGDEIWVSCAQITNGPDLYPYIDGYQPACTWLGAAGTSRSQLTIPSFTPAVTPGGYDDFSGTILGPTPGGNHVWVGTGNSSPIYPMVVSGGQARRGTGGSASRSFWVTDWGLSGDRYVRAIVGDLGDSSHEMVIYGQDQGNYVSLDLRVSSTDKQYRLASRDPTNNKRTLPGTSPSGVVPAAGDLIEVFCQPSSNLMTISVNGSVIFGGPLTVNVFTSATQSGFVFSNVSSGAEGWDRISVTTT